jgi:16S rRNA (guanine527-N7)-methyltransferase
MEPRELLLAGIAQLGIPLSAGQCDQLERFRLELERWNRSYGFVKAEGPDLVIRHFLDSLAAWPVLRSLEPWSGLLDVGSGAGFPGLPLAVAFPDAKVTLLERSAKRSAFLRNVCLLSGLGNTVVVESQLHQLSEHFDLVTFRAFSPLDRELPSLRSRLRSGGWIAAYKGKKARLQMEMASAGLGPQDARVCPLQVPFLDEERHLVLVRG